MARYSRNIKNRARILYQEVGTITAVAKLIGVPESTVYQWREKGEWEQPQDTKYRALSVVKANKESEEEELAKICKEFKVNIDDTDSLKQINIIEGICIAAIKGDKELEKHFALFPQSFETALKSLKICWDAKEKIFARNINATAEKPDLIRMSQINNYYGGKNEGAEPVPISVVSRQEKIEEGSDGPQ